MSEKLTRSLCRKYPSVLNNLAISVLSEKDFCSSLEKRKDIRQKYFTGGELEYCKNRVSSLAGRLAAKIAIKKALQKRIPWKDINILSSQSGEPMLSFSDQINPVSLSISHEEDLVSAFAAVPSNGKTVAVGIDATRISRISALVTQIKILQKILTPDELREVKNYPAKMAEKWAGKEAVSKAIGIGIWHGASLRDIEILTLNGKPVIKLHGKVSAQAKTKNLKHWVLNYIYDKKFVLAAVLATG